MPRFASILLLSLLSALAHGQTGTEPPPRTALPSGKPGTVNLNDSDSARQARAVLNQTIQVMGGQAYLTYQNRSEAGRYYPLYHGRTESLGIPYNYYVQYPDKDRLEVVHLRDIFLLYWQVGNVQIKNKSDIVVIHNGDQGYEITYKGTARQDPVDLQNYLRRRAHSPEWVFRKWLNDPTVALFYDGLQVVDGKPTEGVTLLNGKNDSVSVSLDQSTHYPIRISYSWRDPTDKQKNLEEEVYDNYKPEQGIMTPHAITRYFNGESSHQRYIYTAKYNLSLPDSMFEANATYDPFQPLKKK